MAKMGIFFLFFFFLKKTGTKNFTNPYSNLFLSNLYQNKTWHNFHKRGQRSIVGRAKGLD